jgi:hypothetical protein
MTTDATRRDETMRNAAAWSSRCGSFLLNHKPTLMDFGPLWLAPRGRSKETTPMQAQKTANPVR